MNKTSLRVLVAIAAAHNWPLENLDAMTAFLNGIMDKEVYIEQPNGYQVIWENSEWLYSFLKKAIYGLKQAGRTWWQAIHQHLIDLGFTACSSDTCLFYRLKNNNVILVAIYVDDIL